MNTLKNKAEKYYLKELKIIESQIGSGLTYGGELAKLGNRLFNRKGQGNKFKGVFAADQLDDLKATKEGYFIFNLDKIDEPGSHWIGVIKTDKGLLVYDSFGRKSKMIIPNLHTIGHTITETEDDPEQLINEDNCGSRTMAFLKVYDDYGPEIASWI